MPSLDVSRISLLLLPGLSPDAERSSLSAAYSRTFTELLPRLNSSKTTQVARLDIAIYLSETIRDTNSRKLLFPTAQKLFEETYSLICSAASKTSTELDLAGGVDVRVFLLHQDTPGRDSASKPSLGGPLIDITTLIASGRRYTSVYAVDGEAGEVVLSLYLNRWRSSHNTDPNVIRLPCGPNISKRTQPVDGQQQHNTRPSGGHRSVLVGGTWDHLHIGHKLLLTGTVFVAEPEQTEDLEKPRVITIGITGDELLVNKKYSSVLESWDERQRRTAEFVESILVFDPAVAAGKSVESRDNPGPNGKNICVRYGEDVAVNYTRISDPYGPGITDRNITALVVSAETRSGGKAVNDKRAEKQWADLEVFEVDVLHADGDENGKDGTVVVGFDSKISSTAIRKKLEEETKVTNGGHLKL